MIKEELNKIAENFYIKKIYMKDRKKGEPGIYFSDMRAMKLSYALDEKYKVDWDDVDVIYCKLGYIEKKLYTVNNICKHWELACQLSKELNCKIIYYIACTKFVVSPESDENMMDELMPKPTFFNSYYNQDYYHYSKFKDFDCNADIIIKMKLKEVGPISMSMLTKQYFEYMDLNNRFARTTNRLQDEIEQEYKGIAYIKFKTYLNLKHNLNIMDVPELSSFSDDNKKLANDLYKIVYAVFDHFEYMVNPACLEINSMEAWDAIMEEINFIIKYNFASQTNDNNIKYIIIAIKEYCTNNNMIVDPWQELLQMKWNSKEYMKKVKKNMLKI